MGLNPKGDTAEDLDKWIKGLYRAPRKNTKTGAVLKVAPKPTVTMSSYAPKVRNFSGGDNKGEIAYDIWRYDVKIALKDPTYTKTQKEFAIRRSLSGSAAPTTSPESKDVEELKGMVQQLTHQFTELRDQRQQEHAPYRGNGGYRGSGRGGRRGWNQTSGQNSNWQGQNNNWQGQNNNWQNQGRHDPVQQDPQQQQQRNDYPIVCHRCGQEGHIKIGCRTRMDHSRNLNARKPVQRDADALSRLPISIEAVQAICNSMVSRSHIENLTLNPELVLDDYDPRGTGVISDTPTPAPRLTRKRPTPAKRRQKQKEPTTRNDFSEDTTSDEESNWGYVIREEQGDSDSTIIENLPLVQADGLQNTETAGDAQSSEDTISVDEDLISEDERSASQDEIVQEDTLEQDTSQTDTDDEDEPVPIRRSARERRPPLRFTTGEFDMAKSAITTMSDWEKKIQCLKSISDQTTLLQDLQTEAGRTILDILKSSTNALRSRKCRDVIFRLGSMVEWNLAYFCKM
ncbi:unnamed protein product [Mytilus edulis]|uniref:CCHC-type domain-containing protein n=1 Tax=Mytilus edulis TaxID=6550 RepID=A0A8S3SNU1_MYTED|nr:unnamed protein product [Mytilus edulis]